MTKIKTVATTIVWAYVAVVCAKSAIDMAIDSAYRVKYRGTPQK